MGADVVYAKKPLDAGVAMTPLVGAPAVTGMVTGTGKRFVFDYRGPQAAVAVNRLLKAGAQLSLARTASGATIEIDGAPRAAIEKVAGETGVNMRGAGAAAPAGAVRVKAPRLGVYQPWTGNMDEGWTRWVLEQHEFPYVTLHNSDVRAGTLRESFDVILLTDQAANSMLRGNEAASIRPEYRGGLGEDGVAALKAFVAAGGTVVAMGAACDFAIDKFSLPVRNLKRDLSRDQHFAPGTILRVEVDRTSGLGAGMPAETRGFYVNSPFFSVVDAFPSQKVSVAVRYPNTELVASGWLKGEELMAGRAAVVQAD